MSYTEPERAHSSMWRLAVSVSLVFAAFSLHAQGTPFTGEWQIELCPERTSQECGAAAFELIQSGASLCGDHTFYTPGAGRMNEGFPGSVHGRVTGREALLTVTSGRNGAVVRGKATLNGDLLEWEKLEDVSEGNPPGDALILAKGQLRHLSTKTSAELEAACTR